MSNPKVFEFAKEVGMTPLALMDKIREWQLPVKSHMAELQPEVLAAIKFKLSGASEIVRTDDKPKKTIAKKAAVKKVVEAVESTSTSSNKTPVIRRKAKEELQLEVEVPLVAETEKVDTSYLKTTVTELPENQDAIQTKVISGKNDNDKQVEKQTEKQVEKQAAKPAFVSEANLIADKPTAVKSTTAENSTQVVVNKTNQSNVPQVKAQNQNNPPLPSRKKEVVVGQSGLSSSSTPIQPTVRRNIVGRMDLSRVSQNGPHSGGQQRERSDSGGFQQRPQSGARPGGFSAGTRTNAPRTIRPGFVAAAVPIPEEQAPSHDDFGKRDIDKKSKKFSNMGVATPTVRETEEVQEFNAVEFRKREMVFQPKKKKDTLNREAKKTQITQRSAHKRVLKVNNKMKLTDVANEMGLKAPQIMKVLMQNGVMANMNTDLDFDTIALVVPEFGWEAQNVFKTAEEVATETAFGNLEAEKVNRPPVVTVMGHVDHGKTSLLDAIRNARVASGEAGGITQHIGAYSVQLENGQFITFLDTPGHEAFTAMRARGANATDVAVIVVAADDGMMPQTQEAINHAKAAGVPIIVAVNKMDKPGANPDRIKQQLTELEIVPEEWGGSTIFVEVSALKKTGIDTLLENIKLVSEMQDLKANPLRSATGIVIEAKVEKGKGPVATLLVKDGTVKIGQYIVAGTVKGRVKSLMNDRGERVDQVGPGFPVEVLGLDSTPAAGDKFDIVIDEDAAVEISSLRKQQVEKSTATPSQKLSLEDIFSKVNKGDIKELAIVLKADVHGSLEAIQGMLAKLSTNEVKAKIIHAAVGGVNESDVLLSHTAKGIIIGFNVRPDTGAINKAKQVGVDIRTYSIVYELVDEMKKAMAGLLTPDIVEKVMGRVEVRNTFTVPKIGTIAGCFVIDGKIQRNNLVRLIREGRIVYEGKLGSLKRFKDDAKEVATGFECGIGIENYNDVKVGDVIEAFVKEEIARELTNEARV